MSASFSHYNHSPGSNPLFALWLFLRGVVSGLAPGSGFLPLALGFPVIASSRTAKGGYDTVKIDVTQTPRPTRPTTAIPVRAADHRSPWPDRTVSVGTCHSVKEDAGVRRMGTETVLTRPTTT